MSQYSVSGYGRKKLGDVVVDDGARAVQRKFRDQSTGAGKAPSPR
jgi:hypothetical protein